MRVLQAIKSFVRDHFKPLASLAVIAFGALLVFIRWGVDKLFPNVYPFSGYPELSDISIGTTLIIVLFFAFIIAIISFQLSARFDERNQ